MRITPEQFVVAWQASASRVELCKALGIPPQVASARAAYYRSIGIELRKMPSGRPKLNVAALNAFKNKV